ncbi:MAG: hypothetical protein EAZ97_15910 [Bacteroidetes bacterium]|nr:MAG: hypothetical protein EAZ97_15910 [Bacteroidota bacterium]
MKYFLFFWLICCSACNVDSMIEPNMQISTDGKKIVLTNYDKMPYFVTDIKINKTYSKKYDLSKSDTLQIVCDSLQNNTILVNELSDEQGNRFTNDMKIRRVTVYIQLPDGRFGKKTVEF